MVKKQKPNYFNDITAYLLGFVGWVILSATVMGLYLWLEMIKWGV